MNYNTALSNIVLDISHTKHINYLELMGHSGLSKSSCQTPTAKLENRNQKKERYKHHFKSWKIHVV